MSDHKLAELNSATMGMRMPGIRLADESTVQSGTTVLCLPFLTLRFISVGGSGGITAMLGIASSVAFDPEMTVIEMGEGASYGVFKTQDISDTT